MSTVTRHTNMKVYIAVSAVALGAALACANLLLHGAKTAQQPDIDMAPVAIGLDYNALRHIRADLADSERTLRVIQNTRDDAHRGLVHKGHRQTLPMPSTDSESFDDSIAMRAYARDQVARFVADYSRGFRK